MAYSGPMRPDFPLLPFTPYVPHARAVGKHAKASGALEWALGATGEDHKRPGEDPRGECACGACNTYRKQNGIPLRKPKTNGGDEDLRGECTCSRCNTYRKQNGIPLRKPKTNGGGDEEEEGYRERYKKAPNRGSWRYPTPPEDDDENIDRNFSRMALGRQVSKLGKPIPKYTTGTHGKTGMEEEDPEEDPELISSSNADDQWAENDPEAEEEEEEEPEEEEYEEDEDEDVN